MHQKILCGAQLRAVEESLPCGESANRHGGGSGVVKQAGLGAIHSGRVMQYSASAPSANQSFIPYTASPALRPVTPSPTSAISPENSCAGTAAVPRVRGGIPLQFRNRNACRAHTHQHFSGFGFRLGHVLLRQQPALFRTRQLQTVHAVNPPPIIHCAPEKRPPGSREVRHQRRNKSGGRNENGRSAGNHESVLIMRRKTAILRLDGPPVAL